MAAAAVLPYPDAVAAHDQRLFFSIGVEIGGAKGLAVFGPQLEDVSHLDPPRDLQLPRAPGAWITLLRQAYVRKLAA